MKNQAKPIKHTPFVIVIFVLFIIPNLVFAQQQSYQDIVNRIDEIDFELNKLTLLKESIGMDFKKISDFSIEARPFLVNHNKYEEAISLKREELKSTFWDRKAKEEKEAELQFLIAHRDNDYSKFTDSGGILSFFKVQCKTIEDLQKEYQRTADYYLEQKTEYDKIALELGRLNTEKHDLETKLNYMGDQSINEMDPTGCWKLQFGNYISEITIQKNESGSYVGTLTVNNLNDYVDGQIVFIVSRVSDNTFRGIEYTWKEKPNGILGKAEIPAMITINTDNNYITWTSDQTVTMRRCQ